MVSNESRIHFHATFGLVLAELAAVVAKERARDPENYRKSPQTKLLAMIYRAIKSEIPADPQHASYYQGSGPGFGYSHWKRAKLMQKYWLFFRYDREEHSLTFSWISSDFAPEKYQGQLAGYRALSRMRQEGER